MAETADSAAEEIGSATEGESIGARLRVWRQLNRMTLSQVAAAADLSVGYISQVERGLANPSLETLKRLADAVGHTVGDVLSDGTIPTGDPVPYTVSRRGARKLIQYPGSGIINELLSPDLRRQMEVIWVEAPPRATSGGHPHSHPGEECGIVLAGVMIFWVGDDEVRLEAGDSIYLDSHVPHRWMAGDDETLQAVWLITPPTF